jgi:hypothetical protein
MTDETDEYSDAEAAKKRDAALKRALNTPHRPHKLPAKKKKAAKKAKGVK